MSTGEIPPNASETVRYSHRFDAAGQHVLRARLLGKDDMPWDDEAQRVVSVIESLPVLIVEGRSSSQAFGGAAAFIELALAPREGPSDAPPATPPKAPEGAAGSDASREPPCLVSPTIVPAADFKPDEHLRGCRLVVLADVPKLPAAAMEALADFVHAGGGLLIAPGQEARRESHAIWPTRAGANLLPAVLDRRNTVQVTPVRPALKTFTHPALELLASSSGSDAESCLVKSYWRLAADEKDPAVRVGGLLETGEPLLVERKFGRGAVILIALALDRRDSNLPSLKCFVPLVHELAYYLAAATVQQANVKPGGELVLELPEIKDGAAAAAAARASPPASDQAVEVLCPSGRRLPGAMAVRDGRLRLTFARTDEPGLHRFDLPAELCRRYVQPTAGVATGLPFVVLPDAEESRLDGLDAGDFDRLNGFVPIRRAQTPQELTAALTGDVPGEELWRYAAVAALLALLGEVALTRWIALRRRSHQVETVEFGQGAVDVDPHKPAARRAPQDRTDRNVERVAPT